MNRKASVCGLFVMAALVASPAYANSIRKLDISALDGYGDAPRVRVYSTDGEKWNAVDATVAARFKVKLNAKCRFEGKGNKAYEGDLQVAGFDIIGDTDPADFMIPHSGTAEATFRYAGGEGQPTDPVEVCATELKKRLSENKNLTKYNILAKGFKVNYPGAFEVKYRMYCHATGLGRSDLGSDTTLVNARIECAASDLAEKKIPPPPKRAKLKPARAGRLLSDVRFTAEPEEHHGTCPVGVRFHGKITATRAGEVRYRYVSHDGRESPEFTLTFDAAGTRSTRNWSRTIAKPDPGGQLADTSGEASDWDVQGWYRIEILAPPPKASITARYRIDCQDPAPARLIRQN
ncbi:hypothetical protein [Elongatibacter sediminis]|uniref:Uncharacterized protein n=1 Tax=Elongatibacter sediminis TaxID=3119006 RepID=A0AAW9RAL3_9GAMM